MNESHTIHHIIKHAEQHTGLAIEGLSAPHLLKHGRCFGKHETIWQLEVFFALRTARLRSALSSLPVRLTGAVPRPDRSHRHLGWLGLSSLDEAPPPPIPSPLVEEVGLQAWNRHSATSHVACCSIMQRGAARLQRSASSIRECDDCEHGVAIVRQHSLQCVLGRSGARPLFVSAKHEDKHTRTRTSGREAISAAFPLHSDASASPMRACACSCRGWRSCSWSPR